MKMFVLQHASFEGPAAIGAWAAVRGHGVRVVKVYEGAALPPVEAVDLLVVMGGPMGLGEQESLPWMKGELAFISQCLQEGKRVLGICLGAQMMAAALGARVYPSGKKEIGWFPVRKTPAGRLSPYLKSLPEGAKVFHWHGDTFDLPAGAQHLLLSDAVKNQAFAWGPRALALQFHLEMTADTVRGMVDQCRSELVVSPHVQNEEAILDGTVSCTALGKILFQMLDRWAQ